MYGPFKTRCKSSLNDHILSNPGKAITIYDIVKLTSQPYLLSFTPVNIVKSFEKAGICPVDSLKFEDADFAGVLSYQPSTSWPLNDDSMPVTPLGDSEMVPLAASDGSEFDELNDLDFSHNAQKSILDKITTVQFISEEVFANVKSFLHLVFPPNLINLVEIRHFPSLQPKQNNRRARKKEDYVFIRVHRKITE